VASTQGHVKGFGVSESSGNSITIVFVAFIYSVISELAGNRVNIPLFQEYAEISSAIFVSASAAILFGKRVGGLSAGLGEISHKSFGVLSGNLDASELNFGSVLIAGSIASGAWLTGFLTENIDDVKTKIEENKSMFKAITFDLDQWKRIASTTGGAIVGLALFNSFLEVVTTSFYDGLPLQSNMMEFTMLFFLRAIVLILSIPIVIFFFAYMQTYLGRKGVVKDMKARNIDFEVVDPGSAEIIDIALEKRAFTIGVWTPLKIIFRHTGQQPVKYEIEGVSSSKMYPTKDGSSVLQPNDEWTQTFFILPSDQEKVGIRIRIKPQEAKSFRYIVKEDTIVEITGSTIKESDSKIGLGAFGGINFSVLGISFIWDDFMSIIQNPTEIIEYIRSSIIAIGPIIAIEMAFFGPFIGFLYWQSRRIKPEADLKLAFSEDFEDQSMVDEVLDKIVNTILKFRKFAFPIFIFLLVTASFGAIGFLGYQGYQAFTNGNFVGTYNLYIFWGTFSLLLFWIIGYKGLEIVNDNFIKLPPWIIHEGKTIIDFKPSGAFQEGKPTNVIVTARNNTKQDGIRIVFEGHDIVSPPLIELHIKPNEITKFKISVTPLKQEPRDILAITYPFFDQEGNYISLEEGEPVDYQELYYEVMPPTALGLTETQQKKLFQVGGITTAFVTVLSFISTETNDLIDVDVAIQFLQNNGPLFAILQAPFIYGYFYFRNKLGLSKDE
jgi:hypothetical protein